MSDYAILAAFFALVAVGAVWAWITEAREWNGGVCRETGKPWRHFDTDSQGGQGYTDGCGNYCWVSWPGVRSMK